MSPEGSFRRSVVRGVGGFTPARVMPNHELARMVDTSDQWIRERTGIAQRHIAAEGELTSDLGTEAAKRAIEAAAIEPADIDLIVLATSTPDNTFPASAAAIQRKLGCPPAMAFDLQAVCAGFVYALSVADSLLKTGQARRALVIGAETFSRLLDWTDRRTCVLFGDGAGALVLEAVEGPGERGVLASRLMADGRQYDHLYVDGGPSLNGQIGHLRMNGQEVFRQAVAMLARSVDEVLADIGACRDDIDWLVPHQANKRIIDAVDRRLGLGPERVVITVDRHANTSAASIPLALSVAVEDGRIKPGQLVVLNGMGGGFAWGAAAIRW